MGGRVDNGGWLGSWEAKMWPRHHMRVMKQTQEEEEKEEEEQQQQIIPWTWLLYFLSPENPWLTLPNY